MSKLFTAVIMMAMLPVPLFGQELNDSTAIDSIGDYWSKVLELNEVVVMGYRTVLKPEPDRIVYLTKNDSYAKGLNGIEVLDRIPRVSVTGDEVSVAGKSSVRYIIDGRLLEMPDDAVAMQLKNFQSSGIEKIELLTTPPAKYGAGTNVAYISITTRNESLGARGNLWAGGNIREQFNYLLGARISHTTRKVEISADASWSDNKGINDLDRNYSFNDYEKVSKRSNHFTNRTLGANVLFKYKFTDRICAGAIVNFSSNRLNSQLNDVTVEHDMVFKSYNHSPARPNNALTLTTFNDWQFDDSGKMLSITYNYFDKSSRSFSDVLTEWTGNESRLSNEGRNRYHIHSVKLDAVLPFVGFKVETGAAFTGIGNNTMLRVKRFELGQWIDDSSQSNQFDYDENTAAVYVGAERNFTDSFFAKFGLRYEHTSVKGRQHIGSVSHVNSYSYVFPSLSISWSPSGAGQLALSYSMGITRPNFADLNPFRYYTTTSDYVAGNPDLKPGIAHNAEISYSYKGVYAVLYNSYNHNSISYVTRFNGDGSQQTVPENCVDNNKAGLYASYYRTILDWWNINVGAEVFHNYAKSRIGDFRELDQSDWSGKLELNTSFMLTRRHNLILNLRFSHYFPYNERMIHYESMSLIGCELRYMLLDNRLTLTASVNNPFGWNITRSTAYYKDYTIKTRNNIHSHAVQFRISYTFGGNKVNNVYRDTKERESSRSY